MTQRGIVFETDEKGNRSVVDIIEWPDDDVKKNIRRLRTHVRNRHHGVFDLLIESVPESKCLYCGTIYQRG